MQEPLRQGGKLVKRRAAPSPCRERRYSAQETPAIAPLDTSVAGTSPSAMPPNKNSTPDKEKKSRWRLSNPFHSKDKDHKDGEPDPGPGDSAYFSSENINSSRSDLNTSADPSFASTERRNSRGEQLRPQATSLQPPATSITPPTPPTHTNLAPPAPPSQTARESSQENVHRETYQDEKTGNVVTTTTTTTVGN